MNNILHIIPNTKAGVIPCLFFSLIVLHENAVAQDWVFDAVTRQAYEKAINLQTEEALHLLPEPRTAQELYVASLAEALDLVVTEDKEKYETYHAAYEKRLEQKSKSSLAEDLFLQAEIRLQWTFVYLKFGHEFDAAWNLRQSYEIMQECRKRFPGFTPIRKTSGILEVIIGSVPEKYNWVLALLGMQGSINEGLEELASMAQQESPFQLEAHILYSLTQGFVLQNTDAADKTFRQLLTQYPDNRLVKFLAAAAAIKNSQSEAALVVLNGLEKMDSTFIFAYSYYLKGEAYLHKADYLNSITAYRWFITHYKGQNFIKDAHYKIGVCYWLNGNVNDAHVTFKQAKKEGREASEADKYAARSLVENRFQNVALAKIRYYTDGGYYQEARSLLASLKPASFSDNIDKVEYYYRSARLAHKTGQIADAKTAYAQVIDMSGDETWYFAPNAQLQLGYIALTEGNKSVARDYFQRALEYQKHAYKNSIDSKAKSALAQLKARK